MPCQSGLFGRPAQHRAKGGVRPLSKSVMRIGLSHSRLWMSLVNHDPSQPMRNIPFGFAQVARWLAVGCDLRGPHLHRRHRADGAELAQQSGVRQGSASAAVQQCARGADSGARVEGQRQQAAAPEERHLHPRSLVHPSQPCRHLRHAPHPEAVERFLKLTAPGSKREEASVLYRRYDGHYGLITAAGD
mgnify:CR=1 FL=1